jgi:hypothetical protein
MRMPRPFLLAVAIVALTLSACGSTPAAEAPAAPSADIPTAQATAAPTRPTAAPPTAAPPTAAPPTAAPQATEAGAVVISGAGATPADIQAKVDEYRQLLGMPNNEGQPGTQPSGHREINWDGLPDELAAPKDYVADFFNDAKPPRARGALLSTPGTGLVVSADSDNPSSTAPRFGHINDSYSNIFTAFSGERMFSPIGSNIVDLTFFVPGTSTPALVRGFGAVYADVDTDHTAFEYFDAAGNSLGQFHTPISNNGLSFLGVAFPEPIVQRVRIAYGTAALGPDDGPDNDVAVMDDFIYGEPHAAP